MSQMHGGISYWQVRSMEWVHRGEADELRGVALPWSEKWSRIEDDFSSGKKGNPMRSLLQTCKSLQEVVGLWEPQKQMLSKIFQTEIWISSTMLNSAPRYTQPVFHECSEGWTLTSPSVVFCHSVSTTKTLLSFLRAERKIPATLKVGYSGRLNGGGKIFNKWKIEFVGYFLLHKFCWWSNRKGMKDRTGNLCHHILCSTPSYTEPGQQRKTPILPTIGLQLLQSCFKVVQHLEWWKGERLLTWLLHSEFFPRLQSFPNRYCL